MNCFNVMLNSTNFSVCVLETALLEENRRATRQMTFRLGKRHSLPLPSSELDGLLWGFTICTTLIIFFTGSNQFHPKSIALQFFQIFFISFPEEVLTKERYLDFFLSLSNLFYLLNATFNLLHPLFL